ncbi:MAG: hypothetical protein V8S16_07900 [Gemmiger sp.]
MTMIIHKSFKCYHLCDVQFAHNSSSMTFSAAVRILEKSSKKRTAIQQKMCRKPLHKSCEESYTTTGRHPESLFGKDGK